MEKTKLGLPVGIVGAAAFLLFHFGGFTPGLLLLGYILLCETDTGLKNTALTAAALALAFSLVNALIGLLPSVVNLFTSLLGIFTVNVNTWLLDSIFNFFYQAVSLLKTVVMLAMAFLAFKGKVFEIPFLKKLFD